MLATDWPMGDPQALSDTFEMASLVATYLAKYGPEGYDELIAVAVASGREAGYLPPAEDCDCPKEEP